MRIILDTNKKTITVPWNYQDKLNELNNLIKQYGKGENNSQTFTGYIDEIWKDCIKNSDKCVVTGKKPSNRV